MGSAIAVQAEKQRDFGSVLQAVKQRDFASVLTREVAVTVVAVSVRWKTVGGRAFVS